MFCSNCGAQNPEGLAACGACGAPLAVAQQQPVAPGASVSSNLIWAILVTIFCCQPLGIVAIVFAAMSMSRSSDGDYQGALQNADRAKTWCWVGFGIGLAVNLIVIVAMVLAQV